MLLVSFRLERSEIFIARIRDRSSWASPCARARWRSSAVDRVDASTAPRTPTATITRRIALTTTSISALPASSPMSRRRRAGQDPAWVPFRPWRETLFTDFSIGRRARIL
jgi:hypothetical protein